MTEQAEDRLLSGIDIPKTIAGALAAVCAAVIGSFLGVAGTLVGAAVASIIGSVGTELYQRSLRKGAQKLQTLAPTFVKAPAAVGTPEVAAATEDESPSHTVAPRRQIRWARVAMVAGALFVLAMGSLTMVELITGRSVASTVGNGTKATTTFGGLFNPGTRSQSTPVPAPSATPTSTATSTTAPTSQPTTQAPADNTQTTTQPTTQPTTAPTTGAPNDAPPTGAPNQGAQNQ
jgi:hypothetical protein